MRFNKGMKRVAVGLVAASALSLWAAAVVEIDHDSIRYRTAPVSDAAARLQQRLAAGEATLEFDRRFGYLPSVLKAFDIPVESQMLVFSKTSFQAARINRVVPRAIYFNDEISIGFVPFGDVLEVAAQDPKLGTIFYSLDQDPEAKPEFVRRDDACLQCHLNAATKDVPGLMIRSIYPESSGMPIQAAGGFITDHSSPLEERWGGWFVTGKHGAQQHMGNAFVKDRRQPEDLDRAATLNRSELPSTVRRDNHLSAHSDLVALMTAEHQFQAMNLITRLNFETRLAVDHRNTMLRLFEEPYPESDALMQRRIDHPAEALVEYLFFGGEIRLTDPVAGTSRFAEVFQERGPRTADGRSLRDFDLERRMFRYPLSYVIYTDAFRSLPIDALTAVSEKIAAALRGEGDAERFGHLSAEDRANIIEILRATADRLPATLAAQLERL